PALRCPGALTGTATGATDPCLGAAAAACGAALTRVGGAERHVEEMGPRCTVAGRTAISPQAFLGDDGLALERDAPFCPDLGTASPADASRCQSVALTCQVDAAVRASVPRAAELLGRLGISLDEDGRCLGPPACGNGDIDGDEECDDGDDNSDRLPDHCRTDCTAPSCADGVVDPAHGETCEPPETLLCTADCSSRLPFPPGSFSARAHAGAPDDLARCQQGIVGAAARLFRDSRR